MIVFFPSKTFPATQEIVETSKAEPGFVEIGYISSVHGLEGEVRAFNARIEDWIHGILEVQANTVNPAKF